MASRLPSERRNWKEADMEINLTPMMNLISILIPVLLVSVVFVEITVINVAAPAIGTAPEEQEDKPKPDKPPLNLTVTITDKGYTVAGSGGVLGGEAAAGEEQSGPTIPIIQKSIECRNFMDTVPPPRSLNKGSGPCKVPEEVRMFWIYDREALTRKLVEIKDAFPDERRIIIAAESDIEFECLTNVMDASRQVKDPAGETRDLFDEVVLSPGMS